VNDLSTDPRTLYSKWSPAAWEALCAGPAARLRERVRRETLLAYLELGREAIGLQYIDRPSFEKNPPAPPSFLAVLWIDALPSLLPADGIELLAKAWNLGERLVREPVWLSRYLAARLDRWTDAACFEDWLRESLSPVVEEPAPAKWTGPARCALVDCRPFHEDFLPGRLHLAAASVACVHDRRRDAVQLGVLLRPNGASLCLGRTPCLGDWKADGLPDVKFTDGGLRVGALEAPLPRFGAAHAHVVAPTGFVVAAAKSSQKLWVVESP
jgi:hypothetical protein